MCVRTVRCSPRGELNQMYAILKHGGHQYRVAPGDRLLVERLAADVGSRVTLEPVLLIADGDAIAEIGAGAVPGAHVLATVVAHRRGRKLRVFTYKPKKRRRRTLGYRSQLTELLVDEVAPGGGKPAARRAEKPVASAAPAAAAPVAADAAAEAAEAAEPVAGAPEAPAESTRRTRRPAAEQPAAVADAEPDDGQELAADLADAADAEAESRPAKRAARPRKKADGA